MVSRYHYYTSANLPHIYLPMVRLFHISYSNYSRVLGTALVAQTVKHLPTVQETWVQSLGWEDLWIR